MRTVRTESGARLRKGLMGTTAWLASVAVLSLSSVPAHAEDRKRARKPELAQADTAPPASAAPDAAPPALPAEADAPAEPVQGPSAGEPAEAVQGPSPEAPVEPLAPEATEELPPVSEVPPADEVVAPVAAPNHTASYVLWTASVVSLGIGTAYGVMALKAKKDFDDDPTNKRADKSHDRGIAADVGLGLGVILAATGLAFYFAKDSGANDTSASAPQPVRADVSVAPYVGRSAGGGNLSVRF